MRNAALIALLATACGSKGAVSVVAIIQSPTASVSNALLLRTLNGGFTLHADLGQVAPSSTDVSVEGTMSLVRPDDQSTLVVLRLAPVPNPPYHLEPGGHFDATMTIGDPGKPGQAITQTEFDAICAARMVQIAGTITDSATSKPTPLASMTFEIAGCP